TRVIVVARCISCSMSNVTLACSRSGYSAARSWTVLLTVRVLSAFGELALEWHGRHAPPHPGRLPSVEGDMTSGRRATDGSSDRGDSGDPGCLHLPTLSV